TDLAGRLEMPMAVGTVGGALRAHPCARLAVEILGAASAAELGCVVGAAGLASNLAALRALATEGIQRGHMSPHARATPRRPQGAGAAPFDPQGAPQGPLRFGRNAPPSPHPPPPQPAPGARLEPAACFAYCEAIARAHHENFPIGSFFLPRELRPHIAALYAFARCADDFADEPKFAGRRAQELDRWEDHLLRCFHDEADHPIFIALGEPVRRFDLPIAPFADLIAAFRLDLVARRYATFGDLMTYVDRAARPIGRLILYVFGARDPERLRY